MTVRLTGGSDLKLRLSALPAAAPEIVAAWAEETRSRMLQTAPNARRPASLKFFTRVSKLKAGVYGAFWWIFVDRGAKRHTIYGSDAKNPPDSLKWSRGGRTVFAKRVNHPGQRRQPFISRAAQESSKDPRLTDLIIKQWNRKRLLGRHVSFL